MSEQPLAVDVPGHQRLVRTMIAGVAGIDFALIGVAQPDNRVVTVWNTAVNGVVAGCRPEYMPILVALMEIMVDPKYGNEHAGNTPGSETQIVINGPIIKQLEFNYEQGALRDGVQANTSIGRFWRLCLRNLAGLLLHQNDKGTFGGAWRWRRTRMRSRTSAGIPCARTSVSSPATTPLRSGATRAAAFYLGQGINALSEGATAAMAAVRDLAV